MPKTSPFRSITGENKAPPVIDRPARKAAKIRVMPIPQIPLILQSPLQQYTNPAAPPPLPSAPLWERLILDLWRQKEPSIDDFLKARVALPLFFGATLILVPLLWQGRYGCN